MGGAPLVDLRSDTVTRPTPEMRVAMASAEVGDDAFREDPTVRRLEERVAELLGQEAALLVSSGIQGNQLALGVLGRRGSEVLVEEGAHVRVWEEGAPAALWGLSLRGIPGEGGALREGDLRRAARGPVPFLLSTSVISLENTHLASGGRVLPPEAVAVAIRVAREVGASVHLDGARLWNAEAASGLPASTWSGGVDSVMVSLSKGLGCPVGALLAGSRDLVEEARRLRRLLGGQMRQAGILAAAGLHALEHHRDGIGRDHELARVLARGMASVPGLRVVAPETNVVLVEPVAPGTPRKLVDFLKDHGILTTVFGGSAVRAVTHRDVDLAGITRVVELLERASSGAFDSGWMA